LSLLVFYRFEAQGSDLHWTAPVIFRSGLRLDKVGL
jgi:hypothetical protein